MIQKPAKTDTLVNTLLTGLEMVVIFDQTQTQQHKPIAGIPMMDNDRESNGKMRDKDRESNVVDIEMIRQEHMEQLTKFLTETKAKAKAQKARELSVVAASAVVIAPSV